MITMGATTTFAGIAITSFLSITLFGIVALLMNNAMTHTDTMLQNINTYATYPTEDNKKTLKKSIDDTDNFIRDISSVSSQYLQEYLDTIDTAVLSDDEKQSIIEAKKMLDKIEARDPADPEAVRLKKNLETILARLDNLS